MTNVHSFRIQGWGKGEIAFEPVTVTVQGAIANITKSIAQIKDCQPILNSTYLFKKIRRQFCGTAYCAGDTIVKESQRVVDLGLALRYNKVITMEANMIKQLRKVGNSNALILDKPILELLGLEEGGQVQLTIQDGILIVTPANPKLVDAENIQQKLDYVMKKRQKVLRRLAQ